MAAIRETGSAKLAAAAYKKETGIDLCKQTAWRLLTRNEHAYRKYRKVSMLSHAQAAWFCARASEVPLEQGDVD